MSYSGAAVGAFIFPMIFESLISTFHLQPSLLIMGGITLLAIMGAILLTPSERTGKGEKVGKKTTSSDVSTPCFNSSTKCSVEDGPEEDETRDVSSCEREEESENVREKKGSESVREESENGREERDCLATKAGSRMESVLERMKKHMKQDMKIMVNPYFTLVSLVYIAYIMGNVTFLMILPDFAIEVGLSKSQGIFLLSIFSLTDLIGRLTPLLLNYFTNESRSRKVISNKFLFVSSISMLSIILLLFPILGNSSSTFVTTVKSLIPLYHILLTLTLLAGFFSGFQMILPPVLLSEYLGPSQTAVAFGLTNFICGISSFSRPFIIEAVRNQTKNYDFIFYIFSAFAAFASLSWILESILTWSNPYDQVGIDEENR